MKKVKALKYFLTALLLGVLSFSCEVGLGEAVDVTAPVLTITSPSVSQSVPRQFMVTGQASDETGLKTVSIEIEGDGFTEKIKWQGNVWKRYDGSNWVEYTAATNTGTDKEMQFSVPIDASVALSGHEYTITTKVFDLSNNEGGKSKDERNVIVDTTEPVVSIIEPERLPSATDPEFAKYVLRNNSVLPKIKNGSFSVSGSQKEDTSLDYLVIYLDTETSPIFVGQVDAYPVKTPLVKKVITGSNLRNWSTTITSEDFTDNSIMTGAHILRLVTESHDQAGNVEIKSQGWFKYDNGADIPWISATFGFDTAEESFSVSNRCYPRCSMQGQAYDDDGLKSISVKIYDETGNIELVDYSIDEEKLSAEGYPTYKAWSLNALSETRTIIVKVSCVDINGKTSEEVIRYLTISDVNAPNISNLSPANGSPVLIGEDGNFFFSGKVDDDGSIDFVKVVRIKNDNETDQISYFDKDHSGWKNCTSAVMPYTDEKGNKVWMLPLSDEITDDNDRHVRTWGRTFNIFTDFGIDGTSEKLSNQKFIILAQDVGQAASLDAYSLQGDIDPPRLTIDRIYLNADDESYKLGDTPIELPKPFNRGADLKITDKIKISGTWGDNSTDLWTDKTKHGQLVLKVADKTQTVTVTDNGTWETDYFSPADSSVSVITASISDWAGNITSKSRSYYVNSSTPVLSRIGAETPDGAYSTGTVIKITMEFNKAVIFEGGTPVLKLNAGNNKRTATYESGNDTSKHVFTYTVQAGDDVAALNVKGIEKAGITWRDDAPAYIDDLSVPTSGGASLGEGRAIVIDTKAPELESISAVSGTGWNKAGSSIFIQAKFSENINITPTDLSTLKLVFDNGGISEPATKTGPDTLLFKYIVKSTDENTTDLKVSSVQSSGYEISDIAGNKITSIAVPSENLSGIKVDVKIPPVPVVTGLPAAATVYADSFTFTITGFESNASEKKYTLDGSTWIDYPADGVTVSTNGDYSISAKQVDAAGNPSSASAPISKSLNTKKIISYITAEQSDGTYTTDDKIVIKMICNEAIKINETANASYLVLNTTPVKNAYYKSGSGTTELKFEYVIEEGDSCNAANGLNVSSFVSSVKADINGINFISRCDLPSSNNLANNRTINVVTGAPTITSLTLDETGTVPLLKIKFSNPVSKKAGNSIRVSQTYEKNSIVVYNAPAVLTKAQYNNFKAVTDDIDLYYEKGVNGLLSDDATPDLSEKYVLKFDKDGTTAAVREFFKNTEIDSTNNGTILDVFIPIASSKVKMDATDKSLMVVTLSDAYKLPVKGAEYTITVPEDIAVDNQGHVNPLAAGKTYSYQQTFTLNGCEKPSIRIDKSECTISGGVATQPLQAQVKIDCQTPGKTIKYSISTVETETKTINDTSLPKEKATPVTPSTAKAPVTKNGTYSTTTKLYIGDSSNKSSGYKITIDANPDGTDIHAKEIAYRSVVRLQAGTPGASGDAGGFSEANNMNKVYIRGGDSESGNSTTVGFPLSWNSGDYGKTKMMTQDGDYWYYASWNISVNLYYGFLRGNTGSSDADTMANGPLNWCWASCSWVGRKHLYYLQPGTSFTMVPVDIYGTGGYGYQLKHAEYRPQATQKNGYGVLVNSIN